MKFSTATIAVLTWVLVVGFALVYPYRYLAADSFTYFTFVRVWWDTGLLYSFSGVDHATGIHPGYYFFLLPWYGVFGVWLPSASFILNGILVGIGAWLLYRAYGEVTAYTVLFLSLTPFGMSMTNNGQESALLFVLLSLLAFLFTRRPFKTMLLREAVFVGLAVALVLAARLDSVFFLFVLYLGLLRGVLRSKFENLPTYGLRNIIVATIIPAVVGVGIACVDYFYGGSLIPISGQIKSSFPHISIHWVSNLLTLKLFLFAILITGAYLAWVYVRDQSPGLFMQALFVGVLVLWFYNGFFVSDIGAWYGTLAFFTGALTTGLIFKEMFHRNILPISCSTLVFYVSLVVIAAHFFIGGEDWVTPHHDAARVLAEYAKENEAAAALKDGVFAFYATVPVYNLPGLANNEEYREALFRSELDQYFIKHNIRYVVGGSFGSGVQVPGVETYFDECRNPFYDTAMVTMYETGNCPLITKQL